MRFKIDWASFVVGRKFTIFALFYFLFEGKFQAQDPRGAYIRRGDLTESFTVTINFMRPRGLHVKEACEYSCLKTAP